MVTASTTKKSSPISALLPVLGVLLALVVGVGVWLLPEGMVEPKAKKVSIRPAAGGADGPAWIAPEPHEWTALFASVDQLREPDKLRIDPEPKPDPDGDSFATPIREDLKPSMPPWTYEGFIQEPSGFVAVVRTTLGQRLIYKGDTVVYNEPRGDSVSFVVSEVSAEKLTLTRGIYSYDYQILRVSPSRVPDPSKVNRRNENGLLLPDPGVSPADVKGGDA